MMTMDSGKISAAKEQTAPAKKRKILYVITKSNWGGAARYVYELATSLSKEHYEVAVAFGQAGALKEKLDAASIRTISIPSLQRDINLFSDLKAFFFLIVIFWREKPDVVHLNSSKIGGLGAFAGRIVGIPKQIRELFHKNKQMVSGEARGKMHPSPYIIFTGHGWAFNEDRNLFSKAAIVFLHWLTVVLAHKTIAVSLKIQSQISQMPFVRGKTIVIHNGVPVKQFEAELLTKKAARSAMGIITPEAKPAAKSGMKSTSRPNAEILIGTVSELHKNKGLDFLIKAAAELMKEPRLPRWRILIISDGEERANLEVLITQYNLKGKVTLKGYLANARIYLKAFDIFTLTSRTEGLPYAILEAGMAGLPVLASNVGGIPEIIDQLGSGILVAPGDIKAIRDGLSFLIKNPDRCTELGQALKAHVEQAFSLDQMLTETEQLYTSAH
jgi:glycosyltransferase involved in cell wall biosynthesis